MNKQIIGIYAVSTACYYWDETNLKHGGIGGSEIWAINLGEEFQKRGYQVIIFGNPKENHISKSGVEYVHHTLLGERNKNQYFDYFILSRNIQALSFELNTNNIFLMMHDPVILKSQDDKYVYFLECHEDVNLFKIKKIAYQSEYQKYKILWNYPQLSEKNLFRTFQAINFNDYEGKVEKKNKMLWSSQKVRGSKFLIEKIFPIIKREIPNFEIDICGYLNEKDDLFDMDGINFLGNISHKEMVEKQKESKIWIYPNTGYADDGTLNEETFCITAIENAVAENAIICGNWGCWSSTLEGYNGFVGNELFNNIYEPISKEKEKEFAEILAKQAIKCLQNEDYRKKLSLEAKNICQKYTWNNVAKTWINEFKEKRILLCCIGRYENQYIREFIEYYKQLGFTNICLYDNNYDGEEYFENVISDYIDSGFVILKNYRNRKNCQLDAYEECYREYNDKYDWIAFFDCDEFLTLNGFNNINDYLSLKCFEKYDMIHVNWMTYGDNGFSENNGRPLLERFKEPLPYDTCLYYFWPENNHIKSIIRGHKNNIVFNKNSHTPYPNQLKCCNNIGKEVNNEDSTCEYNFEKAYLKHFMTKSAREYAKKLKRGFPDYEVDKDTIQFLIKTRFYAANKMTEDNLRVFKEEIGVDFTKPLKSNYVKIFMLCHTRVSYGLIDSEYITPLQCGADINDENVSDIKDNTGDNISKYNQFYTEDTGLYWIWKNVKDVKYKGQMQYRRRLHGIDETFNFNQAFSEYDAIIAEPMNLADLYELPFLTLETQYLICHNIDDLKLMEEIIKDLYPEYSDDYDKYIKHGKYILYSNGFILKSEDYDNYCEMLFTILKEWLTRMGINNDMEKLHDYVYDKIMEGKISNATMDSWHRADIDYACKYQMRIGGSLAERFFTLYAYHNFKNILFVPYDKPEGNFL